MSNESIVIAAIQECHAYYAGQQDWVKIAAIRDIASESGVGRIAFDIVMIDLALAGRVTLVPEDVQCSLTSADRMNGLYVGGEVKHLVLI